VKNICSVLIFAILLSITPYDYLLSKADSIAHAADSPLPTLHDAFDTANSTWTWHHEDQDGGRWAVTNTINYYDAAGAKTSHTIEYAQRSKDGDTGDTTFSAFNVGVGNQDKSTAGYWFKLEKFDETDQNSQNIYVYIYTAGGLRPEQINSDPGAAFNHAFENVSPPGISSTIAKKIYGLYWQKSLANDPITKNKLGEDAIDCKTNGLFTLVPDIPGYVKVPATWVGDLWTLAWGNQIEDRYTNTNVKGRCMARIGTIPEYSTLPPAGTGLFGKYEAQVSDYLNSKTDPKDKPNLTEATLTPAEIPTACNDLFLGDPTAAKAAFLDGFPKALDYILANAVDNTGAAINIPAANRNALATNVKKAFDGSIDNDNKNAALIGAIDDGVLYQQFYGGYGVNNHPGTGYSAAPTAKYPNEYYDTNKRLTDKKVMNTLEGFTPVKPENSTIGDQTLDMDKTLAKAAKASAKDDPSLLAGVEKLLTNTSVASATTTLTGILFVVIMAKTGLISKAASAIFGPLLRNISIATQEVILNIGVGLESFFGSLAVALLQICIIFAAVLIGIAVVWYGHYLLDKYWQKAYTRAYYASFYSWWLGTKAADFHSCMLKNAVGKSTLTAAKAAALGLTEANVSNELTNLDLTKGDLAKESATVAAGQTDNACNCGEVTGSNIMNLLKRSFCAVICWTFNVGKGLQENATCLFNDALGTINKSATTPTTRGAAIGCT